MALTQQDLKGLIVGVSLIPFCQSHFFFFFFEAPNRKLSLSDVDYFYHRFFMSASVNLTKLERFLAWYLPVMKEIRFKRHIKPMWLKGLLGTCPFPQRVSHVCS